MKRSALLSTSLMILATFLVACHSAVTGPAPFVPGAPGASSAGVDGRLRRLIWYYGITPLDPELSANPDQVALGQALFFDKVLSGNRDLSCATCHHPTLATGDALSLSIGTGGIGLGPERLRGAMRPLVPRNAPEIFNRSDGQWSTMFWDGRLSGTPATGFTSPEEFDVTLPEGLESVLAAQALFPVVSRAEMRGARRDVDVFGQDNELAAIDDQNLEAIWQAIMERILAIPAYKELLLAAYPDVTPGTWQIQHVANAIGAFEAHAFTLLNSPWDRYLAGDNGALSEEAKRGALLFYGKANCVACHSGNLFTDQAYHDIGVPLLGPGKGRETPYQDLGRWRETGDSADRYAFRTPPLRNVAITGPWMHNGAYLVLEDAVRHHLDPVGALESFTLAKLSPEVRSGTRWPEEMASDLLMNLDRQFDSPVDLTDQEVAQLMAFLDALTDPAAEDLSHLVPETVPSGLPVDENPPGPLAFAEVTAAAGIDQSHHRGYQVTGQAWGDVDNDGWLDLYLTNSVGANTLYHNQGEGQGESETVTFELSPYNDLVTLPDHYSGGASFADYNNDGWLDLYVLGQEANVLFHNDAGRGFTDVTALAGVGDTGSSKSASWGDFDADGDLDLYVANWSCSPKCPRPDIGDKDTLYRNNGDGTFSDITHVLGTSAPWGAGFVAAFTDYDNDGDLDIYLVNDEFINPIGNKLWRNDGPGCTDWCFTEVATMVGADERVMGMGLAVDDYDQDGLFDFYFSNAGPMRLLENQGGRLFEDVAADAGVALDRSVVGWGAVALDYDNDGHRDIYQALMRAGTKVSPFNPLFRNLGDGTFEDLGLASGAGDPGPSVGVAYADYNNDGWVDLVVGNYDQSYRLYRNLGGEHSDNGWLTLKLLGGVGVNRDAVGARVTVTTDDGRMQVQEVRSGGVMGGSNALDLYFGLGEADIEQVEVRWPDGRVRTLSDLTKNRRYTIP